MPKTTMAVCLSTLVLLTASFPASADWSSRSEVGFVAARGNTRTETANAKFEFTRELERWKHAFGLNGLYGKSGDIESARRWDTRYQVDNNLSERAFWFTAIRYEDDRYSGFDYQGIVSSGLGRHFIDTNTTKLTAQVGVGYRLLRQEDLIIDPATSEVIDRIPGERGSDIVGNARVTFDQSFNDATKLLNTLIVESGSANTLTRNDLAFQVKMTEVLAVALGLSVRHNSQPQPGLKKADTLTTVNLVYQRPLGR